MRRGLLGLLGSLHASIAVAQVQGPAARPMPPPSAEAPAAPPSAPPSAGPPPAAPPSAGPPPAAPPSAGPPAVAAPAVPSGPWQPTPPGAWAGPSPPAKHASKLGRGITFEASLGVGRMRIAEEQADARTYDAGSITLGLGWWISSRNALTVRLCSANHRKDDLVSITTSVLGVSLQHWFGERLWMGVGVGSGSVRRDNLDNTEDPEPERGLGLDVRAGYSVGTWGQHSLSVSVEMAPVLIEQGSSTALGLGLAYQLL